MSSTERAKVGNSAWPKRLARLVRTALAPRSSGEVTLAKAHSHGYIRRRLAETSVRAMAHRVGVSHAQLTEDGALQEDMVRRCTGCRNRDACHAWLTDPTGSPDAYQDFCANADRFERFVETP